MVGRFRDELLANFRTGYDDDEEVVSFNASKNESSKKVGLKFEGAIRIFRTTTK